MWRDFWPTLPVCPKLIALSLVFRFQIRLNPSSDTFTAEFVTSVVGEHNIEIVINEERLNATPNFHTFDADKIRVGEFPQGMTGMPVEVEGT